MAERFTDDLKRRILEANNLVDVVQAAVGKLTRAGRNLKACCPFHNEKTPSFNVNVDGQYFKCFGCGKGGDVITFVMLHERVSFPEAIQILADRAGIRVEHDPKAAAQYDKEKEWKSNLYRLNDAAAKFYREQLFSDAGKAAREYIKKRGLTEEICEQFRIGYAPPGGSPLLARLQSQRVAPKAIVAAGLATQRDDGSVRDFFYDRLMFPITNMDGRVIAFGGRILGLGEPKYLNTRDTHLFSKTSTVYGLDHAKEEIKETKTAIIVEGYTDVMMCHQFGVTNVVACLGTAITAEHIRQLRRVADKLVVLTDSDAAGAKASERSLTVLFQEEMPAKVARLPGADKDPCDYLLAHGKDPFVAALSQTVELFDYKFDMVLRKHDIGTPMGLKNAAEELMSLVSVIPNTLLKNQYRYEVLRRLNIDERDLRYEQVARRTAVETPPASDTDIQGEGYELGMVPPPENELAAAERELLRFLFHEPAWFEQAVTSVDLAALGGKVERLIGCAVLEALGEGKLPPDVQTLAEVDLPSVVAREVIQRLRNSADDGIAITEGARALCVALAEASDRGIKLDPRQRLDMLIRSVNRAKLYLRHRDADLRFTRAKLAGDAQAEEEARLEVMALRKDISRLKAQR
ncbi:MAG TPA: DNA primase [Planctomycetota bacterium]|nr:DNA primase [Planctomycetota bacterium]